MIKQSELEQAYRIGVSRALQEAGLTKVAGPFGELLSNPMVSRALIGAGIGGVGGGVTDIGAGRGALAGAAAGALSVPGAQFGRKMFGSTFAGERHALQKKLNEQWGPLAKNRGAMRATDPNLARLQEIEQKSGFGTRGWRENMGRWQTLGGVGAGTLGAGGVLAMTNPPEKPWYQRMF